MENQENLSSSTDGFVHLLKAAAAKQVKTAALAKSLTRLDAETLESLSSKWDWSKLSASHEVEWSIDLIRRFEDQWKWNALSANTSLPWSFDLIAEFQENWNWKTLSANSGVSFSIYLMSELEGEWDWKVLSARTDLPWTVNLIKLFIEHWSKRILSKNIVAKPHLELYKAFERDNEYEYDEDEEYEDEECDEGDSNRFNHSITIQFTMTYESDEGRDDAPRLSDFSEQELMDLRACIELELVFDKQNPALESYKDLDIIGLEVIYDGITPNDGNGDMKTGYWFENGQLCGIAAPIVRFQLNQIIDIHDLLRALTYSSVWFKNAQMENNPVEGRMDAYITRPQGDSFTYTIRPHDCNFWDYWSPDEAAFCGKVFHFPDGMDDTVVLAGMDFILKRESWIQD
jgi:hypothetical protein